MNPLCSSKRGGKNKPNPADRTWGDRRPGEKKASKQCLSSGKEWVSHQEVYLPNVRLIHICSDEVRFSLCFVREWCYFSSLILRHLNFIDSDRNSEAERARMRRRRGRWCQLARGRSSNMQTLIGALQLSNPSGNPGHFRSHASGIWCAFATVKNESMISSQKKMFLR